jgi:hypothetical protein
MVWHRRFNDVQEECLPEIEELAATHADLARLHDAHLKGVREADYSLNKHRFANSLTPEQMAGMRLPGGLPFRMLKAQQQTAWLVVNRAAKFSGPYRESNRLARIFGGWGRSRLEWTLATDTLPEFVRLDYSRAAGENADSWIGVLDPKWQPPQPAAVNRSLVGTGERVESLPLVPERLFTVRLPAGALDAAGPITLSGLVDGLERTTLARIAIPQWARERRLLVCVPEQCSLGNVLTGLCDLYGWECRESNGGLVLRRPVVTPTTDPRETFRQARAAFSPSQRFMMRLESGRFRQARFDILSALVRQDVLAQLQRGDGIDLGKLNPTAQRRIAMQLQRLVLDVIDAPARRPEVDWCLVAPQEGRFTLEGDGPHPTMLFHVARPDGRLDSWGWALNYAPVRRP